jgi:hypothetical protein
MSNIGDLVERLVKLGVSVGDASDVVAQAFAAGAASGPVRARQKTKQMTIETVIPPKKATRLPADFVCDMQYALSKGLSQHTAAHEAERFKNFWAAKAGKDGVKQDWPATWRNWVLSTAERLGATPRAPSPGAASVDPRKLTQEQWAPILSVYAKTSNWNPAYGPEPGNPGSFAPKQSAFL